MISQACQEGVCANCMIEQCACPHHLTHDDLVDTDTNECPPHQPHNLGMIFQGPSQGGLMIDRVHLRLCRKCHLAYWEELPSIPPLIQDSKVQLKDN